MTIEKPESEGDLASILATAYNYACSRNYPKAIELCDWLIQYPATEIAGRQQRAAVKTHMGEKVPDVIALRPGHTATIQQMMRRKAALFFLQIELTSRQGKLLRWSDDQNDFRRDALHGRICGSMCTVGCREL